MGTHRRRTQVMLLCVLSIGCGGDDAGAAGDVVLGGESGACGAAVDRLHACGVLTDGLFRCIDPSHTGQRCALECLAAAECDDVRDLVCASLGPSIDPGQLASSLRLSQTDGSGSFTGALLECYLACDSGRECTLSGGAIMIPDDQRCDGAQLCDDGRDEQGCLRSPFDCGDVQTIAAQRVCDGRRDCPRISEVDDEADCSSFRCEDGGLVGGLQRCDGGLDCLDGSDETGCGQLFCN